MSGRGTGPLKPATFQFVEKVLNPAKCDASRDKRDLKSFTVFVYRNFQTSLVL